ncbi:MAG TPA: hypothetical protein PLN21_19405 [Gemmatales bacterium]|nr:hypothetical protein [Gemmatales bacterium]
MPTPRPTRWLLRITVAMLTAFVAWWAVHELVRPQPCLRFTMPAGVRVQQARELGPWLILQTFDQRHQSHHRQEGDRLLIFDFAKQCFIDCPEQVKPTGDERWFDKEQIRANGPSIIVKEKPGMIKVFDTANGTLTKRVFPDRATVQLSEDGSTLFESNILPLAPWAALSPAPLSGLSTALLMSCDAQRLAPYEIGFQLVQVRQIPSFAITSRYALPPHAEIYNLNLSADGKYLLHGFGQSLADYLPKVFDGNLTDQQVPPVITRPIPRDIPDNLRLLRTLRWMFPESLEALREWTRVLMNHDRYDRLTDELWVRTDLTGVWPDLGSKCDIYDAHTGKRLHTVQMTKDDNSIYYRCLKIEQDWAFIGYVEPFGKEKPVEPSQAIDLRTRTLHLPTGKTPKVLPLFFNDLKHIELAPGARPGVGFGLDQTVDDRFLSRGAINDVQLTSTLFRFNPDGTIDPFYQSRENYKACMIPHSNQLAIMRTWKYHLPEWLMEYAVKYPWLINLLRADRLDIVDAESTSTLWSFDILDGSNSNFVPTLVLSDDRKFIVVPVELVASLDENFGDYRFDVYRLPLSTWVHRWPWLAAWMVLALLISQGFRRCRVGYWVRGFRA